MIIFLIYINMYLVGNHSNLHEEYSRENNMEADRLPGSAANLIGWLIDS